MYPPRQSESGQGDLGTLASVVTSLANLTDSLSESLNNSDTSDDQQEEQSASEITRYAVALFEYVCLCVCVWVCNCSCIVYVSSVPLTPWPKP